VSEFRTVMERAEWTERAACREHDLDLFFLPGENNDKKGRKPVTYPASTIAICNACPVANECLTYALNNNERYGLWGGKTPNARRQLRRRLGLTAPDRNAQVA